MILKPRLEIQQKEFSNKFKLKKIANEMGPELFIVA